MTTDARYGGWDFTIPGEAPTTIDITGGGVEMPKGFTIGSLQRPLESVPTGSLITTIIELTAPGGDSVVVRASGLTMDGSMFEVSTSEKNSALMAEALRELARRKATFDEDDLGVYPAPPVDSGDR
jgi:hypothetical protein